MESGRFPFWKVTFKCHGMNWAAGSGFAYYVHRGLPKYIHHRHGKWTIYRVSIRSGIWAPFRLNLALLTMKPLIWPMGRSRLTMPSEWPASGYRCMATSYTSESKSEKNFFRFLGGIQNLFPSSSDMRPVYYSWDVGGFWRVSYLE